MHTNKPVPLWLYNAPALFSHQQQTFAILWALQNLSIDQMANYYPFLAAYRPVLDRGNQMLVDKMALKLQAAGRPPVGVISWAQSLGSAEGAAASAANPASEWNKLSRVQKLAMANQMDFDLGIPLWQAQGFASAEAMADGTLTAWKNAPPTSWAIPVFAAGAGLLLLFALGR